MARRVGRESSAVRVLVVLVLHPHVARRCRMHHARTRLRVCAGLPLAVDSVESWRLLTVVKKKRGAVTYGNILRGGVFLDFVRLATRTMHPHGACVRGAARNRIDPHRCGIERPTARTLVSLACCSCAALAYYGNGGQ